MNFTAMRCDRHEPGPVFWQGSDLLCWACGGPGGPARYLPDAGTGHRYRPSSRPGIPESDRL